MNTSPSSFKFWIDEFRVDHRVVSPPVVASGGERMWIYGWAVHASGKPISVSATIGGTAIFRHWTPLPRPDVAKYLNSMVVDVGFRLQIDMRLLVPGTYDASVVVECEGEQQEMLHFSLVVQPKVKAPPGHKILIAGAPRSASRHVRSVFARYYEIVSPHLPHEHDGEMVLTPQMLDEVGDVPFVWHFHPMARDTTVQTMARYGVAAVVTWRNLADTVISLDDHMRLAGEQSWRNTYMYVEDREAYCALEPQKRYQFIIREGLPWYLGFYLSWRKTGMPLFLSYDAMVRDPVGSFGGIIAKLDGHVDQAKLAEVIGPAPESGVNVGVNGRSTELMSAETKELLETLIVSHPSDIEELRLELPWVARGAATSAASSGT